MTGLRKSLFILLLSILGVIKHPAQAAAKPMVTGIADKRRFFIICTELFLIIRASFLASITGRLALFLSAETV